MQIENLKQENMKINKELSQMKTVEKELEGKSEEYDQ